MACAVVVVVVFLSQQSLQMGSQVQTRNSLAVNNKGMYKAYSVNCPMLPAKQIRPFSLKHLSVSIIVVLLTYGRDVSMQNFCICESVLVAFNPIYPAKGRKKRIPWCGLLLKHLPPYGSLIYTVYFGAGYAGRQLLWMPIFLSRSAWFSWVLTCMKDRAHVNWSEKWQQFQRRQIKLKQGIKWTQITPIIR